MYYLGISSFPIGEKFIHLVSLTVQLMKLNRVFHISEPEYLFFLKNHIVFFTFPNKKIGFSDHGFTFTSQIWIYIEVTFCVLACTGLVRAIVLNFLIIHAPSRYFLNSRPIKSQR